MEFSAEPMGGKIVLNWKTAQEVDVQRFVVERSINDRDFIKVGDLAPKGSDSAYEFTDTSLGEINTIYYYRLKVLDADGSSELSESISVIPKISSFARTWGSIKALFQ